MISHIHAWEIDPPGARTKHRFKYEYYQTGKGSRRLAADTAELDTTDGAASLLSVIVDDVRLRSLKAAR